MSLDIQDTYSVVVPWCTSNAGVVNGTLYLQLGNVPFDPDFAVIRNVTVNNDQASLTHADPGNVFVVRTNLSQQPVFSFGAPGNFSPETIISLKQPVQNIQFALYQIQTDSTLGPVTMPDTWYVAVSIDFIRLRRQHLVETSNYK